MHVGTASEAGQGHGGQASTDGGGRSLGHRAWLEARLRDELRRGRATRGRRRGGNRRRRDGHARIRGSTRGKKPDEDEAAPQTIVNPYRDTGRNDPCPCGSGLKFKKCHGAG